MLKSAWLFVIAKYAPAQIPLHFLLVRESSRINMNKLAGICGYLRINLNCVRDSESGVKNGLMTALTAAGYVWQKHAPRSGDASIDRGGHRRVRLNVINQHVSQIESGVVWILALREHGIAIPAGQQKIVRDDPIHRCRINRHEIRA